MPGSLGVHSPSQDESVICMVRWCAALVVVVLTGCGSSNPCPVGEESPPRRHVHANGLQLSVGETCKITKTSVGFVIETPNKDRVRNPFTVSIELLATRPEATGRRVRYLGSGRILWYSATYPADPGMGGPEWELVAFEHMGDHWIRYREHKQDERQPHELWDIARGLSYVPP
jgi:hypothetical protein